MWAFASYGRTRYYMIVPFMLAQNVVFDRISSGTSNVVLKLYHVSHPSPNILPDNSLTIQCLAVS